MKASTYVARLEGSRPRETSRKLILEIVVWIAAFALLLCQPADYSRATRHGAAGGAAHPDLLRAGDSR